MQDGCSASATASPCRSTAITASTRSCPATSRPRAARRGCPRAAPWSCLQDMTDRLGPALERTLLAVGDQGPGGGQRADRKRCDAACGADARTCQVRSRGGRPSHKSSVSIAAPTALKSRASMPSWLPRWGVRTLKVWRGIFTGHDFRADRINHPSGASSAAHSRPHLGCFPKMRSFGAT